MNILLLSTVDNPLLPYFFKALCDLNIAKIFVAYDSRQWSEKDHIIWKERTEDSSYFKKITHLDKKIIPTESGAYFKSHNGFDFRDYLSSNKFDLILNAGTPRKLNPDILGSACNKIINIHPGQLPEFRGCSAVEWAIHYDQQIANTAHIMTPEYDDGPSLLIEKYKFPMNFSYSDIRSYVLFRAPYIAVKLAKRIKTYNFDLYSCEHKVSKKSSYWSPCPTDTMNSIIQKIETKKYKYLDNIYNVKIETVAHKNLIKM